MSQNFKAPDMRDVKIFFGDGEDHIFRAGKEYEVFDAGPPLGKIKGSRTTVVTVDAKWAVPPLTSCRIDNTGFAGLDGKYRTIGNPVDNLDGTVELRLVADPA